MLIRNPSSPVSSPNPKPKSGLLGSLGNPQLEKQIKRSLKGQKTPQPSVPKTSAVRGIKQYPTDPMRTQMRMAKGGMAKKSKTKKGK